MRTETSHMKIVSSAATALMMVVLALLLAACGVGEAQTLETADAEPETPAVPVKIATAELRDLEAIYATTTTLEAVREAEVTSRVAGDIERILVEEGDRVTAGQLLARLDDRRLSLELARARADLERLSGELERQRALLDREMVSADSYDQTRFAYEQQKAAVELAELERSYTLVRAPIDGVVSMRYIKRGNNVVAGDQLFRVTDISQLEARFQLPQQHRGTIAQGQIARLSLDAYADRTVDGVVARISPVVDSATGSYRVTVGARSDGELRPGMFARIGVVYDVHADTVVVPAEAVVSEDADRHVYVVVDGAVERRKVQVGIRDAGRMEITEGVEPGETVVTVGHTSLKDGSRVETLTEA